MSRSRIDPKQPERIEHINVARIQAQGGTAEEALTYLMDQKRKRRKLSECLRAVGCSSKTGQRLLSGKGSIQLYTAELIAEACGYRLVLEALDEKNRIDIPDEPNGWMRHGRD